VISYTVGGVPTTVSGSAVPVHISVTPSSLAALYDNRTFVSMGNSGTVLVTANVTVFGTPMLDTLRYALGDPSSYFIEFMTTGSVFFQGSGTSGRYSISKTTLYLRQNGRVTFANFVFNHTPSVGVKFALVSGAGPAPDSTEALAFPFSSVDVTFPNPGTYTYSWNLAADTLIADPDQRGGTIVVR
jgi:hypothetical protein